MKSRDMQYTAKYLISLVLYNTTEIKKEKKDVEETIAKTELF